MTLRIATDSIGTGNRIDLGTLDSVFVPEGVTVASTDNNSGIVGSGTYQSARVNGNVTSAFAAILLGSNFSGPVHNSITIGASGVVDGTQFGILINGGDNRVVNNGQIFGGGIAGVDFQSDAGVSAGSLVNYGLIDGASSGVLGNSGSLVVTNYGTIGGGLFSIQTLTGADSITNYGTLNGAIDMGTGNDTFVNRGIVGGTVTLGNGDDVLDNGGSGSINGAVSLGDGNDTFIAGSANVTVDGGAGVNTLDFSHALGALQFAVDGTLVSTGGAAGDTLTSFTNVIGSANGANELRGDATANSLTGGAAADHLVGLAGNDKLFGLAGDDVLAGGKGIDQLSGGLGADHFVFAAGDTSAGWTSADTIADFSHAEADLIDLSGIDANTTLAGDQAFTFIGTAAYHHIAGEMHYYQPTVGGVKITVLTGDTNGDGLPDLAIQLTGHPVLVGSDLVL